MSRLATALLLAPCLLAYSAPEFERARDLYHRTEYQASLNLLMALSNKGSGEFQLMGQDYFMLGDAKKATEEFDKALMLLQSSQKPAGEDLYVWLGRAYGRRAETSGPLSAPGLASRSCKYFETAVQMDIMNKEATGDLFDYYMGAPGFLGGGLSKAQELARKVSAADPAEGQHLLAVLNEKNKQYEEAEQHLRSAIQLAPKQASRIMELARFLAQRGRAKESDALFDQAQHMAPEDHSIQFYRALTYIEGNRNLSNARAILQSYLSAQLTPDDPPRQRAQALLAKTN
jgi:tetratricopeptide (TPR) repeat protein